MTVRGNLGLAGVTVSDWSQSIYLLTELQLVQGMLLLGERKRETEGSPRGGRQEGQVEQEREGKGEQMESERWVDKENRRCIWGRWGQVSRDVETAAMESER